MTVPAAVPVNLVGGPLRESDFEKLAKRWIHRQLADAAMIRRVGNVDGADIVGRPFGHDDYTGLIIPYIWPGDDHVREYRLRRDHPTVQLDPTGHRREKEKYVSPPGRGNMLYIPPGVSPEWLTAAQLPLFITEGEFKCLSLWRLAWESAGDAADTPAFLPVALSGVWNWKTKERRPAPDGGNESTSILLPDFYRLELDGRRVVVIYDRNVDANESVRAARFSLTTYLQPLGAEVSWFEWPPDVPAGINGIDDWLAATGPAETLRLIAKARLKKRTRVVEMPGRDGATADPVRDWRAGLIFNQDGNPKALLANALTALRCAPEWEGVLAHNEFAIETVALKAPPINSGKPGPWSDSADCLTAEWLQHKGIHVSPKQAREAVETVAREHSFHPVREYLESLAWDGAPRLDNWLRDYLGVAPSESDSEDGQRKFLKYCSAIATRWMLSAVARVFKPGCKADCCLILEGPQGAYKSSALRTLASPWFCDEISDLGSKDSTMQTHGVWIIEIAELDSMSRAEVGKIKAFLSRATDRFRPPYGARLVEMPRQSIFAGSVNKSDWQRDETGARRFWPVSCRNIHIDELTRDRDQLWAEAVFRYRSGEHWWLDDAGLIETAAEEQKARYEGDAWLEPISMWLENPIPRRDGDHHPVGEFSSCADSVSVHDVLMHALDKPKGQWAQADLNRVARCLRVLDWERFRVRVGTKLLWRYRRCSQ